jgi:hypothetical protein
VTSEPLQVEITFATPERQELLALEVPAGTTIAEAIEISGIEERFPDEGVGALPSGVWGRVLPGATRLQAGDRIEIYRPLQTDPRDARRLRAAADAEKK